MPASDSALVGALTAMRRITEGSPLARPYHRAHRPAASAGNRKYNQHSAVCQSERRLLHRKQRQLRICDRHAQQRLRNGQLGHRQSAHRPNRGEVDVLTSRESALATGAALAASVAIAVFRVRGMIGLPGRKGLTLAEQKQPPEIAAKRAFEKSKIRQRFRFCCADFGQR